MDDQGITVVPLSSAGLAHRVSDEVVSTGAPGLDAMLGPGGIYRGSSVLVSGVSGAGKTILGASFAAAACARGERCMFFSFEESLDQLVRTVGSAGIQLRRTSRPACCKWRRSARLIWLRDALALMQRELDRFQPSSVIVDPVTSFRGPDSEVHALLLRMLDMLKTRASQPSLPA